MKNFLLCLMLHSVPQAIIFAVYEILYVNEKGVANGIGIREYDFFMSLYPMIASFFIGVLVFRFSSKYTHCESKNYSVAMLTFIKKYLLPATVLLVFWCIDLGAGYTMDLVANFREPDLFIEGVITELYLVPRYLYAVFVTPFASISCIFIYIFYSIAKSFSSAQKNATVMIG